MADRPMADGRRPIAKLLQHLETHLASEAFLAGAHPTIADLALYSYLVVASEGGVDLAPYEAIRAWFGRIERLDGFVPMPPP